MPHSATPPPSSELRFVEQIAAPSKVVPVGYRRARAVFAGTLVGGPLAVALTWLLTHGVLSTILVTLVAGVVVLMAFAAKMEQDNGSGEHARATAQHERAVARQARPVVSMDEALRARVRGTSDAQQDSLRVWFETLPSRTWGVPGAALEGAFGAQGKTGAVGERRTAAMLARMFASVPGACLFHGLSWPGSVTADIDHVVVVGNRIAVIDSKMWKAGHYTWDGATLLLDGSPSSHDLKLFSATAALVRSLRDWAGDAFEVSAWVVQQTPNTTIETTGDPAVRFVTAQGLADELDAWLLADNPTADVVNLPVVHHLTSLVKHAA